MQGTSMLPLLASKDVTWRNSWLYEYFLDFPYTVPAMYALRTENYKYIEYESGCYSPEVYNIASDPGEKKNLYGTKLAGQILPKLQQMIECKRCMLFIYVFVAYVGFWAFTLLLQQVLWMELPTLDWHVLWYIVFEFFVVTLL